MSQLLLRSNSSPVSKTEFMKFVGFFIIILDSLGGNAKTVMVANMVSLERTDVYI